MGLLENKGWEAQDLYNEYLDLKQDISKRIQNLEYQVSMGNLTSDGVYFKQDIIDEKVDRLKVILNHMKVLHGISMEDLILLSIGVDV